MAVKPTYEELEETVQQLRNAELDSRRMEELLKDELVRWRILFEQASDGIVILDENGKVYEANKRYAEILGYTPEEMRNLHVWDWDTVFTPEQLVVMIREIDDAGAHFETQQRRKDGSMVDIELSNNGAVYRGEKLVFCVCRDITDRKRAEREREKLIEDLRKALAEIKTLKGIMPICSYCKKIRDDTGYWNQLEQYIKEHSEAKLSHGVCPECAKKYFSDYMEETEAKANP
jgi:PAS domain S-box-containing protein